MALKKYFMGSQGPYYYDDADDIEDPDGDFAGQKQGGFVTDGSVTGASVDGDLTDDNAIHHSDFSVEGVMIKSGTETYTTVVGEDVTTSYTVVTGIQAGGGGGVGFQYKTRTITLDEGVITDVSAESGWSDI